MHVYERTRDPEHLEMLDEIYEGGYEEYDGYNWENEVEWFIYDDTMWWVIALARAHEITGNKVYLEKSITGFDRVWNGSYDPKEGGMYWDFHHSGKNACINYPTAIAAMRLYSITGDQSYLEKAKKIYASGRENLFDQSNGRIADHLSWINYNSKTAWNNRDLSRNIIHRDYSVQAPPGIIQSYEASSGVAFRQLLIQ